MTEQIERDFKKFFFGKNTYEENMRLLRKLDPTKIGSKNVLKLVDVLRESLKEHTSKIDFLSEDCVGVFGSGGDRLKTINASTLATIIASSEMKICKLGTRGLTSKWGSQDLLAKMGYELTMEKDKLKYQLENFNFCFLTTAGLGHPYNPEARRAKIDVWKEGNHDIFKVIVPASYIIDIKKQVTGVYDKKLIPYVIDVFNHLGKEGLIIHSFDGIDELSPTANSLIIEIKNGKTKEYEVTPEELGIKRVGPEEIAEIGDLDEQVKCSWEILEGKIKGSKRDFILMNVATILYLGKKVENLKEGIKKANDLLDSGKALQNFKALINSQNPKKEFK